MTQGNGQLTEEEQLRIELNKKTRMTEQLAARVGQQALEISELQTQCETYATAFQQLQKELDELKNKGGDTS
ncbi:hypothetical protein NSQ26_06000 [Bacillus sp. FSL W7-1360]